MRIVVSGTHAVGKSTLIGDLADRDPRLEVLGDPYEDVDGELLVVGPGLFVAQLEAAADRLLELGPGRRVIAERGPVDMLAYLGALADLGRSVGAAATVRRLAGRAAEAMRHVDLVVLLTLDPVRPIHVADDEDPALREAMEAHLVDLLVDPDLVGGAAVIEVAGDRRARVAQVEEAIRRARS